MRVLRIMDSRTGYGLFHYDRPNDPDLDDALSYLGLLHEPTPMSCDGRYRHAFKARVFYKITMDIHAFLCKDIYRVLEFHLREEEIVWQDEDQVVFPCSCSPAKDVTKRTQQWIRRKYL